MNRGEIINKNISYLIDTIIQLKKESLDNRKYCIHPKWQYPETDVELEMNKIYCQKADCDKCKTNYLKGLRNYYELEYLVEKEEN